MIVDNFDRILNLLEFTNPGDFYFLQIIQRKKDGNDTGKGNNGARTIKSYYITSKEHLMDKKNKIIELCKNNRARAYIAFNRRNSNELCLHAIQEYVRIIQENITQRGFRVWDHVAGKYPAKGHKLKWMLDIDTKDERTLNRIIDTVTYCSDIRKSNTQILDEIPTLSGYHLITTGFDLNLFKQELEIRKLDSVDHQKDGNTLLYAEKYE